MTTFRTTLGITRSLLMYYGIPGRARRFRRFYGSFIRPGDVCFEIGAHVGNHTRAWLKLGARVVAIEPQPAFVRLLRRWYGDRPDVTTLDALIEQFGEPAYCKIDVEGYERAALDGLSRPLRTLSFEFIPAAREIALGCIERLECLSGYRGYRYNWTIREEMRLRGPDWLDAAQMARRLETMPPGSKLGDVIAQRV